MLLACGYLLGLALPPGWRPLILRLCALGLVAGVVSWQRTRPARVSLTRLSIRSGTHARGVTDSTCRCPGWSLWPGLPTWPGGSLPWRHSPGRGRRPGIGLVGAMTVPFYEQMAYYAGWWRYVPALRVGHVPIYVVVFEGAVAALFPCITPRLRRMARLCARRRQYCGRLDARGRFCRLVELGTVSARERRLWRSFACMDCSTMDCPAMSAPPPARAGRWCAGA